MDKNQNTLHPIRLQRSRKQGSNLKNYSKYINGLDCVYVGRGSKWGNPFKMDENQNDILILDPFTKVWKYIGLGSIHDCIKEYEHLFNPYKHDSDYRIQEWSNRFLKLDLSELKGKNLACWCSIVDKNNNYTPCHADVLLRLSNGF